jgi:hypothetical protein
VSDLTLDDPPQLLRASDASTSEVVVDFPRAPRERIGRRWRVGAALLGAIVLVGATVLVTRTVEDAPQEQAATTSSTPIQTPPTPAPTTVASNTVTPPVTTPGDGSTDAPLLPEGASSTPDAGELVASVAGMRGTYYLYADGRLIGPTASQPGWVEQRLTAEGVERVRSEFLNTGVFNPGQPAIAVHSAGQVTACLCVRDGGRLLARSGRRDRDVQDAAERLFTYLEQLGSSLPPTEWADQEVEPYVASRISACLTMVVGGVMEPADLTMLLPLFPARVAELLGGRETTANPDGGDASCFEMTRDEARALADEFLAPSGGGLHEYWGIVIRINAEFTAMQPGATAGNVAFFSFRPLLPHGEPS